MFSLFELFQHVFCKKQVVTLRREADLWPRTHQHQHQLQQLQQLQHQRWPINNSGDSGEQPKPSSSTINYYYGVFSEPQYTFSNLFYSYLSLKMVNAIFNCKHIVLTHIFAFRSRSLKLSRIRRTSRLTKSNLEGAEVIFLFLLLY